MFGFWILLFLVGICLIVAGLLLKKAELQRRREHEADFPKGG